VLAANIISNDTVSQIRDAGLTVVRFGQATSIEDVAAKTELIGSATGNCAGATDSVRWIRQNVDAVESAVADRSPARSLYLSGTFTTGADTFLHDVLTTAGAENVAAEAGVTGFRPLNEEIVADRDPEWIVLPGAESTVPEGEPYASTTAVAEGNVLRVDPNYVAQPAPRSVVYALRNATEAFHADAYGPDQYVSRSEAAAPDPTATTSAGGDGGSGTDGTTAAGEDEDDGGDGGGQGLPGFGPVAALAALAAVLAGLGRRRSR
jgi:iron complex transport system substrate-binding protein